MPNHIPIVVPLNYKLDPKYIQRISQFVDNIPTKVRPTSITVIDPDKFQSVVKAFNNPDKSDIAFTIGGGRIYLNGAVFSPTMQQMQKFSQQLGTKQLGYIPEHALAHEISHLNDTTETGRQQESHDGTFNQDAAELVNQWASKQGQAYRNEQARINSDVGKIQPQTNSLVTNENAKQQSQLIWNTRPPQNLPYQPPSSLPIDVLAHQ